MKAGPHEPRASAKLFRAPKRSTVPTVARPSNCARWAPPPRVVCSYCSTTLDATNPQLVILQKWESQIKVQPLIPLGSRGKLHGAIWEAIGFQQRGINVEGTDYFWRE